jgi:ABC-type amino acid transport substrate-binding protein
MRANIILILLIIMFINTGVCQERESTLKDNTFVMAMLRAENDHLGKWQRMTYTEIFKRLGMKIEFRDYPAKRASMETDAGNVDGEPGRISSYAAEHPNLIRVEESPFSLNFSAFAVKDSIPQMNGWDSLKGTNYKVEYQRGIKICEINLPKVVSKENLSDVTEADQGLKKLISGRTDLFVYDEIGVLTLLQKPEFKASNVRFVGVMESGILYPCLHKKHAALAPKMAEIIKAMKVEGLIEKYRMEVDKEFGVVRK